MPASPSDSSRSKASISRSEHAVMDVLWAEPGLAATDVHARLSDTGWSPQTVKTLLSRLVGKHALRAERDGRRFRYHPLIARDAYAASAAKSLARRLFGGRAAPLVAHLAEGDGLTDADIEELEALIEKMKNER